jgi:hypothetical protein
MLECAAEILGGTREVADYLGVAPTWVRIWMRGTFALPDAMFLKLVDLLSAPPLAKTSKDATSQPN